MTQETHLDDTFLVKYHQNNTKEQEERFISKKNTSVSRSDPPGAHTESSGSCKLTKLNLQNKFCLTAADINPALGGEGCVTSRWLINVSVIN